jgi:glycosyltransferase involved in cell wall biosynthesis
LQIIGTGDQRQTLEAYIQQQGLTETIEWLGWVDYGSLGQYFQAADVFVFPSLEDIWGMVVLEAMAFGKPVLCSRWVGAAELITEGKNGAVFDPHQPQQLADRMQQFIDHPEAIATMGQSSKTLMQRHTPKDAAQFFAAMTQRVMGRSK